eukprot:CAMPEP_0197897578 /NCGR_PEP_ID=MMETSP1439-20131203/42258_1 /TAXON_ID=66791 /ORGANISM="Gonyaulax spinifera, Strain CCMP409" /LENGTH=191 /DNA_ID=CAMNT_0043518215 /DNA_START=150 /DNA_END=722 /DNA_ORIENTATION=+
MRALLVLGSLMGAGGLVYPHSTGWARVPPVAAEPTAPAEAAEQARIGGSLEGDYGRMPVASQFQRPAGVELDPRYRFVCVRQAALFALHMALRQDPQPDEAGSKVAPPEPSDLATFPKDAPYVDPCVLGMTKLAWAAFLTGVCIVILLLCMPCLLIIARRRPPGHPIIPGCDCYGGCCCEHKRPPPAPVLQ